jgi:RNA polymerase sigma factor (TIGR02999 family)
MRDITRILRDIEQADEKALDELLPLVYDELRKLAATKLAQEKPGQTLSATALVHEAYMRLVNFDACHAWNGRTHFFAAAAEAMRRILVDRARQKKSQKRGGTRTRIAFCEEALAVPEDCEEVLAVHEALDGLAAADPQAAQLVKLRYFAGLSIDETAGMLNISPRSADRVWSYARAWLQRTITGTEVSCENHEQPG